MAEIQFSSAEEIYRSGRFCLAEETFATPVGPVTRPVIHHPGAVAVMPRPDPDSLLLIRQYRYPLRRWIWEIPAGTAHADEDPMLTAGRELEEETGFRAGRLVECLRLHPAVGVSDELMVLFEATDLRPGSQAPDHGEFVETRRVHRTELAELLGEDDILEAKTLIALGWLGWWSEAHRGLAR